MKIIKLIIFMQFFFNLIASSHNSFKNECGPYDGLEDEVIMPKKEDCFNSKGHNNLKCCYVEGEKDLLKRSSCVLIENTSEKRIELINELSEIATKLKVDCNTTKEFPSDCGITDGNEPNSASDCSKNYNGGKKCCFIKIVSEQFTGKACKEFESININTVGEAVVAAKTVGAELEVKCKSVLLNINYRILFLFLYYIL